MAITHQVLYASLKATRMTTKTIVLVTGANSGIGYETVKALAQSPRAYHILLGSRSLDRGAAAMNSIQSEVADSLSSIELLEIDVSSDDSIQQAHNEIEERFGRLDVLVNNAGMCRRPGTNY